ncbi:MAG: diguanylate cyclase [Lachnospiraceae bacterium]
MKENKAKTQGCNTFAALWERLYPRDLGQFQDRIHAENVEMLWKNQVACLCALGIAGAVELIIQELGLLKETFFLLVLIAITMVFQFALQRFVRKYGTIYLYLWTALILVADAVFETLVEPNETGMIFMVLLLALASSIYDATIRVVMLALLTSALYVVLSLFRFEREVFRSDVIRLILVNVLTMTCSLHITSVYFALLRRSDEETASARHDSLTRILNRRGGEDMITSCLKRSEGGAFVILDVDRFKHINDTYGHGVGDQALQSVAAVLGGAFRTTDVVMRMGGDEFIVYAVGLLNEGAIQRKLEEIRQEVHEIVLSDSEGDVVSVSMGCIINRGSFSSYDEMYAAADSLLYRAKQEGKDGFRVGDPEKDHTEPD